MKKKLTEILSAGKLEKVNSTLIKLANNEILNEELQKEIIALSARYSIFCEDKRRGTLKNEDKKVTHNQLVWDFGNTIKLLPDDLAPDIENYSHDAKSRKKQIYKNILGIFFIIIIVLLILVLYLQKKDAVFLSSDHSQADSLYIENQIENHKSFCDNCILSGTIYKRDAPMVGASVRIVELGIECLTDDEGNFFLTTPADTNYLVEVLDKKKTVKITTLRPSRKSIRINIQIDGRENLDTNNFTMNEVDCVTVQPRSGQVFENLSIYPLCCKYASGTLTCRFTLENKSISPLKFKLCHKVGNWITLFKTKAGREYPASTIELLGESMEGGCKEFNLGESREELQISFEGIPRAEIEIAEIKIATSDNDYILKELGVSY
ncbi:MAG: hypothetical protein R2824_20630 [Saprospiraceae bacterium]